MSGTHRISRCLESLPRCSAVFFEFRLEVGVHVEHPLETLFEIFFELLDLLVLFGDLCLALGLDRGDLSVTLGLDGGDLCLTL